ncbi:50S ribosomal protein L21 [Chlamydia pecorum]|uniref:Large ribosomal subunit protein bL21 n=1 Tax=Chlamydia pecorum TaxID=85991 RepID=A0AA40PRF3_9CHLA|nr:50S ribosomal protein L21 [Chlamydia pecorum]AGW37703.1 50S ribosomal protein L21 [Chlamydia pecorum PV3056/3]AGW38624.1 50S ribosomal protein L21 [Chlamydia pecorum W73]ETF38851.1 50S ribosomal protein L21 [Chlamydia pecorum VR629]ETF39355.1 50S ribosomal protein L21 [Chlamydia pecorum DBDeUG]ETF40029.1 50S ribosomal protein L21 [Chlamydia pecorum MC/MarsBar]
MDPYAIIFTGSKQYQVRQGDIIDVELLDNVSENQEVLFGEVLFAFDGSKSVVGSPTVANAVVKAECLANVKGEKVTAYKYKKRKNYHIKHGHRQKYHRVRIKELVI